MAFTQPDTLHLLLDKLADNIADYCRYQVRGGGGGALDWRQGPPTIRCCAVRWLDAGEVHPR